jgi:hypothetical protein
MEHYPTYKYNLGNYNHAQGNRINQFSFQLYLYGYHPPMDVNVTHWASRSAPTLPLPHSGSTFSPKMWLGTFERYIFFEKSQNGWGHSKERSFRTPKKIRDGQGLDFRDLLETFDKFEHCTFERKVDGLKICLTFKGGSMA